MDTDTGRINLAYNFGPEVIVVDRATGTAYHGKLVATDDRGLLLKGAYYYASMEKHQMLNMPIGDAFFPWSNVARLLNGKDAPPEVVKMG